ncbi:hypothetical protein DFH29DRAFT_1080375 [Suillus ampliporus]|nr:hypothetical protein DFH29DRAFT_1080375 [Suillus ampliporus]
MLKRKRNDSSASSNSEPEHELSIFERVGSHLRYLARHSTVSYKVHRETNLTHALDDLASSPFVSFVLYPPVDSADLKLLVNREDAGTWMNPNVGALQKHATPSPFGRGEETVMDPSYRHGTELKADELTLTLQRHGSNDYARIVNNIQDELSTAMFVGKKVVLKLYKLAIYGEGGHFDWHRDSTHSDAHHGTVLIALNTEWEGGELLLRHRGIEATVDMHPTKLDNSLRPVVVAFYTDIEHKVMPVTKGSRLVLQYDVEVVGELPPAQELSPGYQPLEDADMRRRRIAFHFKTYPNLDQELIQAVIDEIRQLHEEGTTVVAFPLTHLYRKASVKKEYLKGSDSALFDALKSHFDVVLHPILIRGIDEGEGWDGQERLLAYKYESSEAEEEESDVEGFDVEEQPDAQGIMFPGKVYRNALFYLPQASAILQISLRRWVSHVGNEPENGEVRYFGAGMFVKPKSNERVEPDSNE